jgi:NitT/TauT family transport system permease protein
MPTDATPPGNTVRGGTTTAPASTDTRELEAGLDALQTEKPATAARGRWRGRAVLGPLLAVGVFLAIWQVVVWLDLKPTYVLPGPADVARAFGLMWQRGDVQVAILTSLERGLTGFVVAVLIGTPLGFVVARVAWVRTAFGPIITGLQVLPSVAWVPAAIIWFGLSDATVYFVILMGAVPSVINGLVAGVDHVPPLFRGVGRVLGAGPIQMVRWVILPAALPAYLAGLRQGWAFSWRSLMAAEIIAVGGTIGFGLGSLLQQGRELQAMSIVFAAILMILAVGILIELAFFAPLERRLLRLRGLRPETSR